MTTYARKMAEAAVEAHRLARHSAGMRTARNAAEYKVADHAAKEQGLSAIEAVINEVIEACARECETWRGGGPLTNEVAMRIRRLATTKKRATDMRRDDLWELIEQRDIDGLCDLITAHERRASEAEALLREVSLRCICHLAVNDEQCWQCRRDAFLGATKEMG